nr:MAG TPA: hypothetical protein [Caudoviricetes sp.]
MQTLQPIPNKVVEIRLIFMLEKANLFKLQK